VPIAATRDSLILTDGWDYIAVDLPSRSIRWQRRIMQLDRQAARGDGSAAFASGPMIPASSSSNPITIASAGGSPPDDGTLRWSINEAKTPGCCTICARKDSVYGLHFSRDEAASIPVRPTSWQTAPRFTSASTAG